MLIFIDFHQPWHGKKLADSQIISWVITMSLYIWNLQNLAFWNAFSITD